MTTAELLLQDYDIEVAMTRKILASVPEGKPDFKCHDKSMPLGRLTMHVATLPLFGKTILTTPGLNMADPGQKWPDQSFTTRDVTPAMMPPQPLLLQKGFTGHPSSPQHY